MWKNEIIADFRDQSNILLCEDELTRKAYLDTLFKAHTFYFDDFSNFEPFTKSIHHRVFLDEPSLIPLPYDYCLFEFFHEDINMGLLNT